MRFGRIPKREKQRLLDEMQSYMNSLNESAAMDIDSSPPPKTPPSPEENQSDEAIGAISQAYRDIFVSGQDRLGKRGSNSNSSNNNKNNNNASSFQGNPSPSYPHPHLQTFPAQGYGSYPTTGYQATPRCPVAPRDNSPTFAFVDNGRISYPSNQRQSQLNTAPPPQSCPANYNSYSNSEAQTQATCPWRMTPGTKVLVRFLKIIVFARHAKVSRHELDPYQAIPSLDPYLSAFNGQKG